MNKIEFGCGESPTEGFSSCDIRDLPGVDYVCNAWDINQFVPNGSVDLIYSRHFFEHLTFVQADWTLESWLKILKPGGEVQIMVPDMLFHIKQWLNPDRKTTINKSGMSDEEWAISGFWGKQRETEVDEIWDIHKSGYDYALLHDTLEKHGFKNIERIPNKPKNLFVKAFK